MKPSLRSLVPLLPILLLLLLQLLIVMEVSEEFFFFSCALKWVNLRGYALVGGLEGVIHFV